MSIKIAAAYIRVSTDDQLEYSPDSQLKVIREYAQREGYVIPDEYVYREDDGISGKAASKRPAFRLMIATAKQENPPFECIFVWKYSRFARNQEESIMYKNLLKKRGVSVRSISEPSSDSPFSSLIERIIEWMDEYYLINLASEVRRGMTEKASRGEATGTPPFGYSVKDKIYVPNEHADTVRWIYAQYLSGKGSRAIADELGAMGVKTPRGGAPDNRWVDYMLDNPTYIGKIRYSTEGRANYGRYGEDTSNVVISDGRHEPIIDAETWDAVRAKRDARSSEVKYVRRDNPRHYMLKGLIRCGDCGATLVYQSINDGNLQCHKYARGQCHVSHSISVKKADAAVIKCLEDCIASKSFKIAPKQPRRKKIVHEWDKLIAAEEAKLQRAKNALLEGAFSMADFVQARDEIQKTLEKLHEGKAAESEEPAAINPAAYSRRVEEVLETIKSPDVTVQAKNEALRSIIDKIVYNKPDSTFDVFFAV